MTELPLTNSTSTWTPFWLWVLLTAHFTACPSWIWHRLPGHQGGNAQDFSMYAKDWKNQGKCLRGGQGVDTLEPLLQVSSFSWGTWAWAAQKFLCDSNPCRGGGKWEEHFGWVAVRGFFWGLMAIPSWGQAWVPSRGLWVLWLFSIFHWNKGILFFPA